MDENLHGHRNIKRTDNVIRIDAEIRGGKEASVEEI
jgi:hypothetical protein